MITTYIAHLKSIVEHWPNPSGHLIYNQVENERRYALELLTRIDAVGLTGVAKPKITRVVVAVIRDVAGRYLITKRKKDQTLPGKWCFPGGKVHQGENDLSSLSREVMEEIGILVAVGKEFHSQLVKYDHGVFELHYFECTGMQKPMPMGCEEIRFVNALSLTSFDLLSVDMQVAQRISDKADLESLRGELRRLREKVKDSCWERPRDLIFKANERIQALEKSVTQGRELYTSACEISELRRLEIAHLQGLLQEIEHSQFKRASNVDHLYDTLDSHGRTAYAQGWTDAAAIAARRKEKS